jgi:hypothetical protein
MYCPSAGPDSEGRRQIAIDGLVYAIGAARASCVEVHGVSFLAPFGLVHHFHRFAFHARLKRLARSVSLIAENFRV